MSSVRRIGSDGEPVFGRPVSIIPASSEAVAVTLAMNLQLMKEEWWLDRTAGVGWLDMGSGEPRIFGPSADLQLLESEVKSAILRTNGVSSLAAFSLAFDHDTRRASIAAQVTDIYGGVLPLQLVIP